MLHAGNHRGPPLGLLLLAAVFIGFTGKFGCWILRRTAIRSPVGSHRAGLRRFYAVTCASALDLRARSSPPAAAWMLRLPALRFDRFHQLSAVVHHSLAQFEKWRTEAVNSPDLERALGTANHLGSFASNNKIAHAHLSCAPDVKGQSKIHILCVDYHPLLGGFRTLTHCASERQVILLILLILLALRRCENISSVARGAVSSLGLHRRAIARRIAMLMRRSVPPASHGQCSDAVKPSVLPATEGFMLLVRRSAR